MNHPTSLTPATATALALAASLLAAPAQAKETLGMALDPLCLTKAGEVLFLVDQTDGCGGTGRRCRAHRWAWAAFKPAGGTWEWENAGEATLDEDAAPEANAQVLRQLFKAPAAHPCAEYFRAPRLLSPDLPDSDSWFQYSVEKGALELHWQSHKVALPPEAKLWRLTWCAKGCETARVEPKPLDAGLTIAGASTAPAALLPALELALGGETLLGFPDPAGTGGYWIARIPQAPLRNLQSQLLLKDARPLAAKADLFASSRAAGLLDAALQLSPSNTDARLEYARLFARAGEVASAVRELEQLRALKGLRATLDADKAMDGLRPTAAFKHLVDTLPR